MARNRTKSNPDVNSPIVDDDYESDENVPGKNKQREIREPDGDDGSIKKPDIDEPYPSPEDEGQIYPVTDPPLKDRETGDFDNRPKPGLGRSYSRLPTGIRNFGITREG